MSDDGSTPEMIVVDIPPEFADAGFLASVKTADGKLDVNKALNKMKNQESILGKRALPTSESSDDDVANYVANMRKNIKDEDYDAVFKDVQSKALKTALTEAGVLPKLAAKIVAAYTKDLNQQYDETEFKAMVESTLTKAELEMAQKTLSEDEWNDVFKVCNKEALGRLRLAANVGKRFNITEKGVGAGTLSNGVRDFSKKGFCPEYFAEMQDAAARGASQKEKDAIMSKYGYNHEKGGWDI